MSVAPCLAPSSWDRGLSPTPGLHKHSSLRHATLCPQSLSTACSGWGSSCHPSSGHRRLRGRKTYYHHSPFHKLWGEVRWKDQEASQFPPPGKTRRLPPTWWAPENQSTSWGCRGWMGPPQVGLRPTVSRRISREAAVWGQRRARRAWGGRSTSPAEGGPLVLVPPGVANTQL